jgi:hypothetical protein
MSGRRERVGGGVADTGVLDAAAGQGNRSSAAASTAAIMTTSAGGVIVGAIDLPRR